METPHHPTRQPDHIHESTTPVVPDNIRPWRLWLFGVTALACFGLIGLSFVAQNAPAEQGGQTVFSALSHFFRGQGNGAIGAEDDRINLLLLGVGGSGHDGPELSDTILLTSFRPSTGDVGMISVPRDLLVTIPGYGLRKINHVNAYAERQRAGSGPQATATFLGDIFQQEIPYAVKVDFRGFAEIIDAIGGVDVYVERSFTDPMYPIHGMEDAVCGVTPPVDGGAVSEGETEVESEATGNCRYEALTFTEGWTHMDGATALKYARSRHGNNGEGSDFARAARQQKIILAVKDKILSSGTLLNPRRLSDLASVIRERISTTLSLTDMLSLAQYVDDIAADSIRLHVISNGNGLVYDVTNGTYGLLPYKRDWSDFRALARDIFSPDPLANNVTQTKAMLHQAPSGGLRIRVENGTGTPGLAARASELLESAGYTIVFTGNAKQTNVTQTVILDGTDGKRQADLEHIATYFSATLTTSGGGYVVGGGTANAISPITDLPQDVDAVLILGQSSTALLSL